MKHIEYRSIIKAYISRATDNKWSHGYDGLIDYDLNTFTSSHPLFKVWLRGDLSEGISIVSIYDYLLAEAVWGGKGSQCLVHKIDHRREYLPWNIAPVDYHLQDMSISKDPIEYIGQNL